jgi:hypothetical protein
MNDKDARNLNEYMNQEVEYMKEVKQGGFLGLSEVVEFVENDKNLTDEQREIVLSRIEKEIDKSKERLESVNFEY